MANKIDLAEQQLLGFKHAQEGYSLRELVCAMGLTKKEWKTLKKDHSITFLKQEDINEIDEYISEEN